MDLALFAARLLLAAVFAVAGLAKLVDRRGSRQGMTDFGVPARLAAPLAVAVPVAELAVAVALVPRATAWWGALGSLALLTVFVAAISVNLARGRKPDCRCFGQLQSSPIGWRTLARNGILAAVAVFILLAGRGDAGASAVAWLAELTTAELVATLAFTALLALVALQTILLLNLLRQSGRLLLRIDALEERGTTSGAHAAGQKPAAPQPEPEYGLPVGTPAPRFALPGIYGETLTLDFLLAANRPLLLVFTDPGCGPCSALMPEIAMWQREHAERVTVGVISRGNPDANRAKAVEHGIKNVLLQSDREVAARTRNPVLRAQSSSARTARSPAGLRREPTRSAPSSDRCCHGPASLLRRPRKEARHRTHRRARTPLRRTEVETARSRFARRRVRRSNRATLLRRSGSEI